MMLDYVVPDNQLVTCKSRKWVFLSSIIFNIAQQRFSHMEVLQLR